MTDRKEGLVDIRDVVIDQGLAVPERVRSVIEQMNGDPHHFRSGDVEVVVRFSGERTLEEVISHYLAMRDNCGPIEHAPEVA